MRSIVRYFINRPLLTNLVLFGVIIGAAGLWGKIGKEEYPDFTMPWVRFSIPYPGAAAEDVELFVTKPIEEKLKELTGLYEVNATASYGVATFRITLEPEISNTEEAIMDIKDAVDRAELP
jgi:multidrug efflux pump subunit AcrB